MKKMLLAVFCGGLAFGSFSVPALADRLSGPSESHHEAVDFDLMRDNARCKLLGAVRDVLIVGTAATLAVGAAPTVVVLALSTAGVLIYADIAVLSKLPAIADKNAVALQYQRDRGLTAVTICFFGLANAVGKTLSQEKQFAMAGSAIFVALNPFGTVNTILDVVIDVLGLTMRPRNKSEQI